MESLKLKQHKFYELVNNIIDCANENKDKFIIDGDKEQLDEIISQLLDKIANNIIKVKSSDSEEWNFIDNYIQHTKKEMDDLIESNQMVLDYYDSSDFLRIKQTCNMVMSSQKEFNDYIKKKSQSIEQLFGKRIIRNETDHEDVYHYVRQYKKTINPFAAEVSATVFASAENNPIEYVVKYFYPNKEDYLQQIKKLQLLVGELETLKEAKSLIDNSKKEYQRFLEEVPRYIFDKDEKGFYARLGFATLDEKSLTIEYKFSYTSNGGLAQRSFTVPMNEETIVKLIEMLESKLTFKAFAKEQRAMMTKKLRDYIKKRDNYTCCECGNSIYKEPNLLLEIDHIIPVSKGGCTVEENLQTLCWKCNRSKSDKLSS